MVWVIVMIEFHELMRKKRMEKGLSQYDLADLVGLKQPSINHIEMGRRKPSFEALVKICEVLEIPLFGENSKHE